MGLHDRMRGAREARVEVGEAVAGVETGAEDLERGETGEPLAQLGPAWSHPRRPDAKRVEVSPSTTSIASSEIPWSGSGL